jgi:hypothetical protein
MSRHAAILAMRMTYPPISRKRIQQIGEQARGDAMRTRSASKVTVTSIAAGLTLIGSASTARAAGPFTGADIYANCHAPVDDDPERTFAYLSCTGYVEGAVSMARVYSLAMKLHDFCVPPGTNSQTVLDAVVGYLATMPAESKKAPAAILIYGALHSSFPCK